MTHLSRRFAISRRLAVFLPLLLLSVQNLAQARPLWSIPPLSSFDGKRWGELQVGETTFRYVRDRYETGKGAYERSTELTQAKNAPLRVDLLWTKEGDNEILRAITVRFKNAAPRIEELTRIFDPRNDNEEHFYLPGRYEDWHVQRFAPRGVAAMTLREGDLETAPLLLLTTPLALSTLSRQLTSEVSPVERRYDPHENEPLRMDFDEISIDVDLDDELHLPYGEKQRTIEAIEEASAQDTIRFRTRGDGSYQLRVTGDDNGRKGGSISVSATIQGNGPYGSITATGSGSDSWSWTNKEQKDERYRDKYALLREVRESYRSAVEEARKAAEDSFATQMLGSGPPPLWVVRESQWSNLIDTARNWSSGSGLAGSVLR